MTREEMLAVVQAPAYESTLRARAKQILDTLVAEQVAVPEVRFMHEGVPVHMVPPGPNGLIEVGGEGEQALYRFRLPLGWLSNVVTPAGS